jgi:hypothetical protein
LMAKEVDFVAEKSGDKFMPDLSVLEEVVLLPGVIKFLGLSGSFKFNEAFLPFQAKTPVRNERKAFSMDVYIEEVRLISVFVIVNVFASDLGTLHQFHEEKRVFFTEDVFRMTFL